MGGYTNGRYPLSMFVHLGGLIYLPAGTAARWAWVVEQAYTKYGVRLRITPGWNGYRPYDIQVEYREDLGIWAAVPGHSSHGLIYKGQQCAAFDVQNWAELGWARFVAICRLAGLTTDFVTPRELWHVGDFNDIWTVPAFAGITPTPPDPIETLEDMMSSNPIINVVPKNGDHSSNGTIHIGLDDGSFEALRPPFATNIRGIISVAFLGADSGSKDTIPTLSQPDFNAVKAVWATMCRGRTDAAAVWAEGVHAQDAEGRGLYIDSAGKITTTPTGKPLKFTAAGFLASTNALANEAASSGDAS